MKVDNNLVVFRLITVIAYGNEAENEVNGYAKSRIRRINFVCIQQKNKHISYVKRSDVYALCIIKCWLNGKKYMKTQSEQGRAEEKKFPTPAKYKVEYEWLKEIDSLALANAQLNLQTEFPTFKNKKSRKSYTTNRVNGNIMLFHGYIKLPKLKMVKLKQHREIPPNHIIKSCTISMTPTGKYYVSILTEYEKEITPKEVERCLD